MIKYTDIQVDTNSATQFATAYLNNKPVATFTRRRFDAPLGTPRWTVHDTTGAVIWQGMLRMAGRRALANHLNAI